MRAVIQRVRHASVRVENSVISRIEQGLLVFVGIVEEDGENDIAYLSKKLVNLRIFDDETGTMNLSVKDISGEILSVSQFTLMAMTKKGNRPSYIKAAKSEISLPLYEKFCDALELELGSLVKKGRFGANMEIELMNDGPVTICIDTKNKE